MRHAEADAEEAPPLLPPHLYLELLPNIRTVSLAIQPKKSPNQQKVTVHVLDGNVISVEQRGTATLLPLPVKVTNDPQSPLRMTNTSAKSLTLRLQPDLIALQALLDSCSDNYVPWSSQELERCVQIRCASCAAVVIEKELIRTWRDLPSANWAEMMDFWHCHKPHEDEKQIAVDNDTGKGYSAGNHLTARQGVGFVDTLSFLFSPEDCKSVQTVIEQVEQSRILHCASCSFPLGLVDDSSSAWRLYKWSLSIDLDNESISEKYITECWITAELLSIMESQAARKFIVRARTKPNKESILLWLFTPDLWFSASGLPAPQRAVKIMWKAISREDQAVLLGAPGMEELELPERVEQELISALTTNQQLLPRPSQSFQDWQVSLLRRFAPRS